MIINITMTAIRRPELHERVLKSFCEKMFYPAMEKDPRLKIGIYINLDPIGEGTKEETRYIFRKMFPKSDIGIHEPIKAHFGKAFWRTWCCNATPADFTFHLEDDWELLQSVDLLNLIRIMQKFPTLQILRLNAFKGGTYWTKNWNKYIPWNGIFYEIPPNERGLLGFTGHPSLIRQSFINEIAPQLNPNRNPEKQIKGKNQKFKHLFQDLNRYGVWGMRGKGPIVRDIGRPWMIKNGYRKKGSKAWFTEYIKVKGNK
ncbi:MAG: hypothetical protein ACFFDY_01195 [Candidatus Thorarchaeota archaeon]